MLKICQIKEKFKGHNATIIEIKTNIKWKLNKHILEYVSQLDHDL